MRRNSFFLVWLDIELLAESFKEDSHILLHAVVVNWEEISILSFSTLHNKHQVRIFLTVVKQRLDYVVCLITQNNVSCVSVFRRPKNLYVFTSIKVILHKVSVDNHLESRVYFYNVSVFLE